MEYSILKSLLKSISYLLIHQIFPSAPFPLHFPWNLQSKAKKNIIIFKINTGECVLVAVNLETKLTHRHILTKQNHNTVCLKTNTRSDKISRTQNCSLINVAGGKISEYDENEK